MAINTVITSPMLQERRYFMNNLMGVYKIPAPEKYKVVDEVMTSYDTTIRNNTIGNK